MRNISINRNIVECKDTNEKLKSYSTTVLIETSWNVKGWTSCQNFRRNWY